MKRPTIRAMLAAAAGVPLVGAGAYYAYWVHHAKQWRPIAALPSGSLAHDVGVIGIAGAVVLTTVAVGIAVVDAVRPRFHAEGKEREARPPEPPPLVVRPDDTPPRGDAP
jgi:hypothetical protein